MAARIAALPAGRAQTTTKVFNTRFLFQQLTRSSPWHNTCNILMEAVQPKLLAAWILDGGAMLRVEILGSAETLIIKLEGRFTGNDADHALSLVRHCLPGIRLVVDLTEVTFIDSVGQEALSCFGRFGAEFVAQTSYTLDICERLHLRLARDGELDANTSGASRRNAGRGRGHARKTENGKV